MVAFTSYSFSTLLRLTYSDLLCSPRRETKRKTLEEIAAAFGDKVVLMDENDVAAENAGFEEKIAAEQLESARRSSSKV